MRPCKVAMFAGWLAVWAVGALAALPHSPSPISITLALPAQNVDFSDMDLRDENNRPITSVQVRRRFEDVLVRSLNRMLVENLTPLRRAWLELLDREISAGAVWIGRIAGRARTLAGALLRDAVRVAWTTGESVIRPPDPRSTPAFERSNRFLSLVSLVLASTQLLR